MGELEDNKHRGLNTEYPHSDAWVEGPWGYNVFVPMLGDCVNNTLRYYKIQKMDLLKTFLISQKPTLQSRNWSSFVEMEDFIPKRAYLYIGLCCRAQNMAVREF